MSQHSEDRWVIVEPTLCEGDMAWGEASGVIELYDTEAMAEAEIQDCFECMVESQIESGFEPDEEPSAFPLPYSEYVKGRKAIWHATNH